MAIVPARREEILCDVCGERVDSYSNYGRSALNWGIMAHNKPKSPWAYFFPKYMTSNKDNDTSVRWDFHTNCLVEIIEPHLVDGVPKVRKDQ